MMIDVIGLPRRAGIAVNLETAIGEASLSRTFFRAQSFHVSLEERFFKWLGGPAPVAECEDRSLCRADDHVSPYW